MSLNDIATVNISATGPGPSLPGFGIGLLAAYHTLGGSRRVMGPYTGTAGLITDGHSPTGHVVKCATKYFSQTPSPQQLYIGRRAFPFTQLVDLTPVSLTPGTVYNFNFGALNAVGGVPVTYTVPANNTGAAASITYSGGVNTFTGLTGMAAADVGKTFTVSASSHATNNGTFTILAYVSPTSVTVTNAAGVTDAGANIVWTSSASLASACTALAAILNTATVGAGPVAGFVADGTSGTHVRCTTALAGKLIECQVQVPASVCKVYEATGADTSIAGELSGDLAAIYAENKVWYCLFIDSNSDVEIEAAAAWTEANGTTIFVASTSDSVAADPTSTTDALSVLKTNSYFRSAGMFNQYSNMSFGVVGWVGSRLVATPGSDSWHMKTIPSVQIDSDVLVPQASVTAVQAKNGTVYTALAGIGYTQGGTSGGGEWMDQTRFLDWQHALIQIGEVALFGGVSKVPFTDMGILMSSMPIQSAYAQGVASGGYVDGTLVISLPKASDVPVASRNSRTLPSLPYSAKLAGAIHRLTVNGTVSV